MDVISRLGGVTALARMIGIAPPSVMEWRKRGIPINRCVAIELRNTVGIKRWDLRPNDWHLIWPELIGAEGAPEITPERKAA